MLTIDRLVLECRTAHNHPAPQEVSLRLRRIAERDLAGHLSALLDRTIAPTDQRIILIRRLRVHLHLDPAHDPTVVARGFASAITAGIRSADHDTDAVAVFADATEQIARLLIDLAAGTAWTHWYHRQGFPGLAHLPDSAAIRTIAEDSPRRFLSAAARMTLRSLQSVTAAVEDVDADRVVAALTATEDLAPADPAVGIEVCALWLELPAVRTDRLLLVLATHARVPSVPLSVITKAIRAVHALASGAPGARVEADAALRDLDHDLLEQVRGTPAPLPAPPDLALASGGSMTWVTPHGALFLLLPYMIEAGTLLADATPRRGAAVALAGLDVQNDPAVAALLALDEPQSTATAREVVDVSTLRWLTAVNAIGPVRPVLETTRLAGHRIRVVVDQPTGHWLAVTAETDGDAMMRRITDRFGAVDTRRGELARELHRLGAFDRAELGDCMTATNLLRRAAASLPGFAAAGSAHIWREALDTPADVTVTASGWHVRVHRSPLAEILRICGHGDRTTVIPWLGDRAVRVVIAP